MYNCKVCSAKFNAGDVVGQRGMNVARVDVCSDDCLDYYNELEQSKNKIIKEFASDVANSMRSINRPRDFRKSDSWKQFRLESVGSQCTQCGDDGVLHLHHTITPPSIEDLIFDNFVLIMSKNEYDTINDVSTSTIVNSVVSDYNEYCDKYKETSNATTLCGKCHYLKHRHNVSVCQYCQDEIAPKLKRDWGQWCATCGLCASSQLDSVSCSKNRWDDIISSLLNNGDMGPAENWGSWYTGYDDIWQRTHNNNKFIGEWSV